MASIDELIPMTHTGEDFLFSGFSL